MGTPVQPLVSIMIVVILTTTITIVMTIVMTVTTLWHIHMASHRIYSYSNSQERSIFIVETMLRSATILSRWHITCHGCSIWRHRQLETFQTPNDGYCTAHEYMDNCSDHVLTIWVNYNHSLIWNKAFFFFPRCLADPSPAVHKKEPKSCL